MFDKLPQFPLQKRWREQRFPRPVVVALIRRRNGDTDEYLLIKRNTPPYEGMWALVGGKWEFGETIASVAYREVREETGLETLFVALRGFVNERVIPAREGRAGHFFLFVCEVTPLPDQTAAEQNEGIVAWWSAAAIDQLREKSAIIPSDYVMIERFAGQTAVLPHYEADMIANDGAHATLTRFEKRI